MAYISGLTIELAKYNTLTDESIENPVSGDTCSCKPYGIEIQIAPGRMVSIDTTVTMNKVTDSFLSDTTEPEW